MKTLTFLIIALFSCTLATDKNQEANEIPIELPPSQEPTNLYVHVLDVGPGLATVTILPDSTYIIYDVGHWRTKNNVNTTYTQITEIVPTGSEIELLVLSHTDVYSRPSNKKITGSPIHLSSKTEWIRFQM